MIGLKRCLLLGFIFYFIFLIATVPASLMVTSIDERLQNDTISLTHPQGTIWSGSLDLVINKPSRQLIKVTWSMEPLQLFTGRIALRYGINAQELSAKGRVSDGLGVFDLSVETAALGASWINLFLSKYGIEIKTPVNFENIRWQFDLSKKFTHLANGRITWPGGQVSRPGDSIRLDPLEGMIHASDSGEAKLKVSRQRDGATLVQAQLLTTGLLELRVLKRVQGLIGMPKASRPDETLVTLPYKIF